MVSGATAFSSSRLRRITAQVIVLFLFSTTFVLGTTTKASAAAFTCSPSFYQVLSGVLNQLNPSTGNYTAIGSAYTHVYNAMGYNTDDNYLYAMDNDSGAARAHLLKIESDGSVSDLGLPTGLPVDSYVLGDFNADGNLVIGAFGGSDFYVIDVADVEVIDTFTPTVIAGFGNDMVIIDDVAYMLDTNDDLLSVDLATGVGEANALTGLGADTGTTHGAGWTTSDGELFFNANESGKVYQITGFTGSSPAATNVLNAQVTANNDGASCPSAQSTLDPPLATNDSYSTTAGTAVSGTVIPNDTGTSITVTAHTDPGHGTVSINSDGTFTYTPTSGFTGTDTFTYTITDQFGRTATATVTITVSGGTIPATGVNPFLAILFGVLLLLTGLWLVTLRKIFSKI